MQGVITLARVTLTARVRSKAQRGAFFSVVALAACAACSGDGGDAASSIDRASPEPVSGMMNETANGDVGAPAVESTPDPSALPANEMAASGTGDDGTQGPVPLVDSTEPDGAGDAPLPACGRDVTDANKALVTAAIDELFVQGDITAVDRYWGEPYLQHNPGAASGVGAFRSLFSGLISPGNSIYELSRVIGECELVLIHGAYTSFGGPTFDLFRVEGGRLVEHWDAAAVGAGPNASGHTALDGDIAVRDGEQSGRNEALVLELVDRVLMNAAYDAIDDYVSPSLIEHDPESVDGSEAYVQHLRDRSITYRRVHRSIGDGNFVFVLSEGAIDAVDVAHYDLFRIESSLIVEHWNARRNVPATTQSGLGIF